MATYAIGDVHGSYRTLMALIFNVGITDEDTIIFVGDLVDRGPMIKETLDYVLPRPNTYVVLGNHDYCFIDWFNPGGGHEEYFKSARGRNTFMFDQGLSDTLTQLGSQAHEYAKRLSKFPYVIRDANNQFVFCHADYNWAKDEQFYASSGHGHLWNRINQTSHASYSGPIIVHGHTPCPSEKAIETTPDGRVIAINLDGGACYNFPFACLRALRLEDGEIFEQPSLDNPRALQQSA